MLCTADVAERVSGGTAGALMHGPTFMANPLACSVALASLDLLERNDFRTQVADLQDGLETGLKAAARPRRRCVDVRVVGGVGVIQLHEPVAVAAVTAAALARGVWVRPFRDLVYAMPPYVTSAADLGQITAAMVDAVAQVHDR